MFANEVTKLHQRLIEVNEALRVNDKCPNVLSMLADLELKNDDWVKAKETFCAASEATDGKDSYATLSGTYLGPASLNLYMKPCHFSCIQTSYNFCASYYISHFNCYSLALIMGIGTTSLQYAMRKRILSWKLLT